MDLLGSVLLVVVCILICQAAGFIGSVWTTRNIRTWFDGLRKPSFTPPGYLIGIIWTILFTLMGISLFLVLEKAISGTGATLAIALFSIQLVLNVLWNYFFFELRSPKYGLIEIVVLGAFIVLTIAAFWAISPLAALLLVPYIVWVCIAASLNASIYVLNRDRKPAK